MIVIRDSRGWFWSFEGRLESVISALRSSKIHGLPPGFVIFSEFLLPCSIVQRLSSFDGVYIYPSSYLSDPLGDVSVSRYVHSLPPAEPQDTAVLGEVLLFTARRGNCSRSPLSLGSRHNKELYDGEVDCAATDTSEDDSRSSEIAGN